MHLVGSLRSGQNLNAAELSDTLQVLNDLLDAWSAERVMVFTIPYTTQNQAGVTLSLVAGKQKYVLGNVLGTEDFLLPRPPRLERVSVLYSASQSTPIEVPLEMLSDVGWNAIANKQTQSLLPQVCYQELTADGSQILLYFWPIPTQANPIVLYPWAALTTFPDLQTKFSFPPAYARAIRFNVAVDFAAEFPCDLSKLPLVQKLASQSKRDIASLNAPMKEMTCDEALIGASGPRGNIITGSPSRSHRF